MVFVFDECELDVAGVELRVRGEPCPVEPQVFDVLVFLVRHRDRVVPREELLDEVWETRFVTDSALSSRIKSARRAIGDDGRTQRLIRTVHGRGYQFVGAVEVAGPAPAEHSTPRRSTPVPAPATPTLGRDRDIADVLGLLDRARVVTLLGPGGVGKTRLAVEVALRRIATSATEACFVDLTKVWEPRLVPALIAYELGSGSVDEGNARHVLEEALRDRSVLLVLDNLEHVIDAAGIVTDVVRWSPEALVLGTSRARLRIAGEHVYDVAPLSVDPGDGGLADAVALFDQAATALDASFRLERNLADVVTICRTVDGLPLAIELAAGHVRTLPPPLLRTRLGTRLGSPSGAARDAPPRQQTIPATIDWSLQLLAIPEQRLFARLGVFAGRVPLEAVEQVCADPDGDDGDVVDVLGRLVDQSLVVRATGAHGGVRFGLLQLLGERARELLAAQDDERHAIARRHAAYVAASLEDLEARRWSDAADRWVDLVTELFAEVRLAHAWAGQHGEVELAARITAALGVYWFREGNQAEGRRWIAEAFAGADGLDTLLVARLHLAAGLLGWLRSPDAGREHLEPAVDAFRQLGHDHYLAQSLRMLAASYIGNDDGYELAIGLVDDAIERARRVDVQPLIALALTVKGELTRVHGDDARARAVYEESLAVARAAGDAEHVSMCLNNLGFLANHAGDHVEARRLGCEALRLSWRIGRRYTAAQAVSNLAGAELGLERPERAARLIGAADEAMRVLGGARHQGDLSEHETVVTALRAALGDEELSRLRAEGARTSLDDAVALALSEPTAGLEPVER